MTADKIHKIIQNPYFIKAARQLAVLFENITYDELMAALATNNMDLVAEALKTTPQELEALIEDIVEAVDPYLD